MMFLENFKNILIASRKQKILDEQCFLDGAKWSNILFDKQISNVETTMFGLLAKGLHIYFMYYLTKAVVIIINKPFCNS